MAPRPTKKSNQTNNGGFVAITLPEAKSLAQWDSLLLKKWKFVQRILEDQVLSPYTKLVLIELLERHNLTTDRCFGAYNKLAKKLKLARNTVKAAIKQAVNQNWLSAYQPDQYMACDFTFNWNNVGTPPKDDGACHQMTGLSPDDRGLSPDDKGYHQMTGGLSPDGLPIEEESIEEAIPENNTRRAGETDHGPQVATKTPPTNNELFDSQLKDGSPVDSQDNQKSRAAEGSFSHSPAASGGDHVAPNRRPQATRGQSQVANTPLKIPYGKNADNREVAKHLGARYDRDSGCWYAPPDIDLAPFKERGWLSTIPPNSSAAIQEEMRQAAIQEVLRQEALQERIRQARLAEGLPEPQQEGMRV